MTATRKPPKSWRVCPKCRGRATKLYHLNSGKYQCQQCRHEYDPPNGQKPAASIVTRYDPPPIPWRNCDWTAIDDNYGGPPDPVGTGPTEAEAIADLMEKLEDAADAS